MAGACPAPGPDDPLVRGLLGAVDCNVRALAHAGYMGLFQPAAAFSGVLTAILTVYVAAMGYRLLMGRAQLRISDFTLTAIKIGAVIALATQWDAYQTVVYGLLFRGPEQVAGIMLHAVQPPGSAFRGDVFDGLQTAFDDLNTFATGYAGHAPAAASPLLGGAGMGAFLLNASAATLLLSSLGVLLAAKIVLGLLLAIGPIFIALFLFDSTRGVFEGWLRAALAFAFAPLATTVLLGLALTLLEPSLLQMQDLQKQQIFTLPPVYGLMILVLVFAGVATGALIAGGMIAAGFRLPSPKRPDSAGDAAPSASRTETLVISQPRAARVAAAAVAMDRRDSRMIQSESRSSDRRTLIASTERHSGGQTAEPVRLGQDPRRVARPQTPRAARPKAGASPNLTSAR